MKSLKQTAYIILFASIFWAIAMYSMYRHERYVYYQTALEKGNVKVEQIEPKRERKGIVIPERELNRRIQNEPLGSIPMPEGAPKFDVQEELKKSRSRMEI